MNLYRHYKNKPYRYIGEARHSETLDEVVVYETLYENQLGKLWVRPKKMFFESVEVNGHTVPRFQKIPVVLKETTDVSNRQIEAIAPLIENVFGEWDPDQVQSRLKSHKNVYLLTATVDDQVVGFKLGYQMDDHIFYSWLGGVHSEFRRLGIAFDLMTAQHEWCRKQGYKKVQTRTHTRFREMLILNLQHGFEVTGCQESDEGGVKVVLEKKLAN